MRMNETANKMWQDTENETAYIYTAQISVSFMSDSIAMWLPSGISPSPTPCSWNCCQEFEWFAYINSFLSIFIFDQCSRPDIWRENIEEILRLCCCIRSNRAFASLIFIRAHLSILLLPHLYFRYLSAHFAAFPGIDNILNGRVVNERLSAE